MHWQVFVSFSSTYLHDTATATHSDPKSRIPFKNFECLFVKVSTQMTKRNHVTGYTHVTDKKDMYWQVLSHLSVHTLNTYCYCSQWPKIEKVHSPMVCANPISVMESIMGGLYYCYGPHYEMGVAHIVGQSSKCHLFFYFWKAGYAALNT